MGVRLGYERVWIAHAPPGVWSSGPDVFNDEQYVDSYREMGWEVSGPYVAETVGEDHDER